MLLYVIRHGESETNLSHHWTGWNDVNLTDKGRKDAARAGERLKGIDFDAIYASDLTRALNTAQIALPGYQPKITPLLREINVGDLAGNPIDIVTAEERKEFAQVGYGARNGETQEEFAGRIREFLAEVEKQDYQTVAAFAHAGWLRSMLDLVVGTVLPRDAVCCNNCTIAVFEYTGSKWRLHSWMNLME